MELKLKTTRLEIQGRKIAHVECSREAALGGMLEGPIMDSLLSRHPKHTIVITIPGERS